MNPSLDVSTNPNETPSDLPLRVATFVSSALAVPGLVGGAGLVYFLMVALSFAGSDPGAAALIVAGILAVLAGFYLLAGYWRALRHGAPSPRPRLFWSLSAAYNALWAVLVASQIASAVLGRYPLSPVPLSALALGWTAFMVWLSVSRVRRPDAPRGAAPSAPPAG